MLGLNLVIGAVSLVVGLALVIGLASKFNEWQRFAHHAEDVPGVVVTAQTNEEVSYMPQFVTIEYTPRDGQARTLVQPISAVDAAGDSVLFTLDQGARVRVLYDPEHPEDARLKHDGEPTMSTGLGCVFGLVLFIVGLVTLLAS